MARTRDRREGGRVNVYLSTEAMVRLDQLGERLFPGRQRTDGLVVEAALAALEREVSGQAAASAPEDLAALEAEYQRVEQEMGIVPVWNRTRYYDRLNSLAERIHRLQPD
jgi:hypothetical protein